MVHPFGVNCSQEFRHPICMRTALLAPTAAVASQRVPETIYADFVDELKGITSCTERDFGSLSLGHLLHYPSDHSYDVFDGHDLVKGSYPEDVASLDGKPKAVLCVGAAAKPGETIFSALGHLFQQAEMIGGSSRGMICSGSTARWMRPRSFGRDPWR